MEVNYLSLPCSDCIKCNVCLALVIKVKINTFRSIFHHKYHSATSSTYPIYFSLTFFLLYQGALRLANPYHTFSFTYRNLSKSNRITSKGSDYTVEILFIYSTYLLIYQDYTIWPDSILYLYNMKFKNELAKLKLFGYS